MVTSRLRNGRGTLVGRGLAPVAAALVLWLIGLRSIDLGRMNDLGLISVLPALVFAAIAVLLASAAFQLHQAPIDARLLAVHLVVLIVVLYGIPPYVEEVPRTTTVWTHLGFAEFIARTGTTAQDLDARMSWPGFFVGAAFLRSLVGAGTVIVIAQWAAVIFNVLFVFPIVVIARGLTRDERLAWAASFLFALTNWIGQDYFAPQAFAYFLYLVIIAAVVTWLLVRRPRSDAVVMGLLQVRRGGRKLARIYELLTPDNPEGRASSSRQKAAVIGIMVLLFACIAFSHQLMPFVTVASLMGLAIFNRTSLRTIPILFGVMTVAWVSYMTVPFLIGHVGALLKEIGSVTETLSASVTQRIAGSAEHQTVVVVRLFFTLALWGLAGLGAIVRFRSGRRDLTTMLLAVAPFALIALQAYGGEIILRLYLFSLPFVAIFAAGMLYGRRGSPPSALVSVVTVAAGFVIALGFLVARYGNERIDLMTSAEVEAAEVLYETAPSGSALVVPVFNMPWKFEKIEQYQYLSADTVDVGDIEELMRDPKLQHPYLLLTKSQGAWMELFVGLPQGSWDGFIAEINASPAFTVIYRNQDAEILVLAGRPAQPTLR